MSPTTINHASANASANVSKKDPVDLTHYLSQSARRRKANQYKLFYKYYEIPDLQDISGGLPHHSLFPFDRLSGDAVSADVLSNPAAKDVTVSVDGPMLENGLQYGQATGMPEMEKWIDDFTKTHIADCLYNGGFRTLITTGSTDGWNKVLQVLTNEWRDNDPITDRQGLLVEEFTYAIAAEVANVRGLNLVSVKIDHQGIIPSTLRSILSNWDSSKGKRPHMLYTVSIGQNPTGATVPLARRQEIYDICAEYDIIIVEDEPYWFMQYDGNEKCYLNIDRQGRVIRLDSFSKSFTPGCRLGWITGQPELLRRIFYLAEESTQQPSGYTQLMVFKTLDKWGFEGWMKWLSDLRDEYRRRRDAMVNAFDAYKEVDGKTILEYVRPQAGMFVWIKLRFDLHPAFDGDAVKIANAFWVWNTKDPNPTLVNPGNMFAPDDSNAAHTANYVRASFAPCHGHEIPPFASSVGQATHTFWALDKAKIAELAEEYPKH